MKLRDLLNEAKPKYYGKIGAGVLAVAKDTGRFLIGLRGKDADYPNTWCGLGGKAEENENLKQTAEREFKEESGYNGNIDLYPAYTFKDTGFRFQNYIGQVDSEFKPIGDKENREFKWVSFKDLIRIKPKHFGLDIMLKDPKTINVIKKCIS